MKLPIVINNRGIVCKTKNCHYASQTIDLVKAVAYQQANCPQCNQPFLTSAETRRINKLSTAVMMINLTAERDGYDILTDPYLTEPLTPTDIERLSTALHETGVFNLPEYPIDPSITYEPPKPTGAIPWLRSQINWTNAICLPLGWFIGTITYHWFTI